MLTACFGKDPRILLHSMMMYKFFNRKGRYVVVKISDICAESRLNDLVLKAITEENSPIPLHSMIIYELLSRKGWYVLIETLIYAPICKQISH